MTFPKWTKPCIYGALGGAVVLTIIGFTLGGWTINSSVQTIARDLAKDEVTSAMVSACVDMSAADPERIAKLASLEKLSGLERRNAMMETGWATRSGSDTPDPDLADACLAGLELDGS